MQLQGVFAGVHPTMHVHPRVTNGRAAGRAAGATRTRGLYLGEWATVADAEEVGVLLAWEDCDRVALDSRGVIQKMWNLQYDQPRPLVPTRLRVSRYRRMKGGAGSGGVHINSR